MDARWEQEIVAHLPKELEEQAWRLGAMQRKSGKITRACDLLRGLLAYVLCVSSFQGLGAWGVLAGVGDLADTSWRERLRNASAWLAWLLSQQLQTQGVQLCPWLKKAGYGSIDLVDATNVKCVGVKGRVWRIHCVYSLLTQQLRQAVGSFTKVAEHLKHFALQAGAIYVHESGSGYRDRVAQSAEAGAYAVTAFYPGSFPLQDEHARDFEVIKWLKAQRARAGKICSTRAFFSHQEKSYEVRVIALHRTAEQTEQMRRQKCKKASKRQRGIQSETLYLAGWLLVLTTLPAADWSAVEVLSLYRARWHIELLFKRIKQLLSQHRLRAETEETALATVYAIVVSWVMQQEVACEMRSLLSQLYAQVQEEKKAMSEQMGKPLDEEEQAISEWQLQTWSVDRLRQQVRGSWTQQRLLNCLARFHRHFGLRRRKRPHRWQQAFCWLVDLERRIGFQQSDVGRNTASARNTVLA